jgi:two-component system, sensor histidine kinase PdtaS
MERLVAMLPGQSMPIPLRYGMTTLIVLVCAALQFGLQLQSGFTGTFLLLPGVFLAGFLFDRGTAYFAAVLATVITIFLLAPERPPEQYLLPVTLFAITAVGTAFVSEMLRTEMRKVLHSEGAKTVLLSELAHRTKNNLTILSALVRLQGKDADPAAAAALDATSRRILVLAEVYDHLTLRDDAKLVNVRDYLADVGEKLLTALHGHAPIALTVDADEAYVPSNRAVPLAIIANELITNAFKYAFPEGRAGHISVVFRVREQQLELVVEDNGVGLKEGQTPRGIGSRITSLLTQQLGGALFYERLEPGCRVVLRAPSGAV